MQAALLMTALAVAAPAIKEKAKTDTDVTGTWEHVGLWYDGRAVTTAVTRHIFDADGNWRQTNEDGTLLSAIAPVVDVDPKRWPAHFDVHYGKRGDKPKPGIMKIVGDKLTICYNPERLNSDRPDSFITTVENGWYIFEMRRIKAKKE